MVCGRPPRRLIRLPTARGRRYTGLVTAAPADYPVCRRRRFLFGRMSEPIAPIHDVDSLAMRQARWAHPQRVAASATNGIIHRYTMAWGDQFRGKMGQNHA